MFFDLNNIFRLHQSKTKDSNEELMLELEENKKKLKIVETKAFLYRERALKEREKVKKLKEEKDENILMNISYDSWSSDPFCSDLNNTFNSIISSKSPTPSQPSTSYL